MTARVGDASIDETARAAHASASDADVGRIDRLVPVLLGGVLFGAGVRRRTPGGVVATLAGGWLLYRGLGVRRRLDELGADDEVGREPTAGGAAVAAEVERTVTVAKPAEELLALWRDPRELSRVVGHFADVASPGDDRLRWTVRGPLGRRVSWETAVVVDDAGESLRWESLDGSTVPLSGSVRLRPAPGDRGTEVTLRLRFDPPGGALGEAATRRLGFVPETLAEKSIRRFKSLAEAGEIPTLERNPSARGSGDLL
jgi:uncharacterized membrane protein